MQYLKKNFHHGVHGGIRRKKVLLTQPKATDTDSVKITMLFGFWLLFFIFTGYKENGQTKYYDNA